MKSYSIKNQEDFNRIYPTLSVMERGKLGRAFPGYYNNYMNMSTRNYQEAQKIKLNNKAKEAEKKINEALRRDVREETLKAIAGKPNKYFKPLENQEQRDKYANYLKQQKAKPQGKLTIEQIKQKIIAKAKEVGLDPNIALAVAQQESGFNPNALGDGGKSYGLFQIYTTVHPDYKGGFNIDANIDYGVRFLKRLYDQTGGDVRKTFERYNGSGQQARNYSNKVFNIYQSLGGQQTNTTPQQSTQPLGETPRINVSEFGKVLDNIYSSQNDQEGALNNFQDIQYLDLNRPALMGQQMASDLESRNPSGGYLDIMKQGYQNTYDLARQAGGYGLQQPQAQQPIQQEGQEDMMNYNNGMAPVPSPQDYSNMLGDIRGYAQIDNQPQGIREDVLADYLKLMNSLRGQQDQQNKALMEQMVQTQAQDAIQNRINQNLNMMANRRQAPTTLSYYVPDHTNMNITYGDTSTYTPLPTNITTGMDKFKNQLALQTKAQQNNKDILDRYQAVISADEMSKVTGLPAGVFLNADLYKTYAQYIQSPEIEQQAQFKRESGMAPINLSSDLSKQALKNAGDVDVANINAQATLGKTGLAGEYTLANTQLANTMQGANDYRKALLQSQTQQNINKANLMAQVMMNNMNNETKLEVARQAGANALQLAQLQDDLYSNNPVRIQNANAQLTNAMANLMILGDNPEQGFQLYDRIINMGNNPQAQPTDSGLDLSLWND